MIAEIDLPRIQQNASVIRARTGVDLFPVMKADAYGLGAGTVASALSAMADRFCVFALDEAISDSLHAMTDRPIIALGPPEPDRLRDYLAHGVRPVVWTVEQAMALRDAQPILNYDTGMQRFACPDANVEAVMQAGQITEVITHATRMDHVRQLADRLGRQGYRLHASASALLHEPDAWLDAVRPGIALYEDAVEVTSAVIEVRDAIGPVGYTGFECRRFGVMAGGYANGVRPGPCRLDGQSAAIVEVGMQTSFIRLDRLPDIRPGATVTLIGRDLPPSAVAEAWRCSPHEVLTQLARGSRRRYRR